MEKQIDDKKLKEIFTESKVIALVGASAKKDKTSHIVMKYLIEFGFEVIPVNPSAAGQEILGQMTYKSIKEINKQIDIVDIFRPSVEAEKIVEEAKNLNPKTIWLQLGIKSEKAEKNAKSINANYIENSCIKTEYQRIIQKKKINFPHLTK
jgi:predicted CoA-binding protein